MFIPLLSLTSRSAYFSTSEMYWLVSFRDSYSVTLLALLSLSRMQVSEMLVLFITAVRMLNPTLSSALLGSLLTLAASLGVQ